MTYIISISKKGLIIPIIISNRTINIPHSINLASSSILCVFTLLKNKGQLTE